MESLTNSFNMLKREIDNRIEKIVKMDTYAYSSQGLSTKLKKDTVPQKTSF